MNSQLVCDDHDLRRNGRQLFIAVLIHMSLTGFVGVISCMKRMATGPVSMICFAVMVSSVGVMLCGLPMVIGCFLRHNVSSRREVNYLGLQRNAPSAVMFLMETKITETLGLSGGPPGNSDLLMDSESLATRNRSTRFSIRCV